MAEENRESEKLKNTMKEDCNITITENSQDETQTLNEIIAVNDSIETLNAKMDQMEQKADFLNAQLLELLKSNREIREELKESKQNVENENKME